MAIINGRRIDPTSIGTNGVQGSELVRHAKAGSGRRPIIERSGRVQQIDTNRTYSQSELIDKQGRGAKISSMPDRSKGGFGGRRDPRSKQIITEQVVDIAEHLFKQNVEFDEDDAHWMVVPRYNLPPRWHRIARSSALMVAFPNEYPTLPPIGFYLMADLPISPDGHFFAGVAHEAWQAPIAQGWKWYCVYIAPGAWQPTANWRDGDNLYTYFHLVDEALGNN